jgi:hypothetical protein
MKKTLLFKNKSNTLFAFLVFILCVNVGLGQTNLVLNGTADDFSVEEIKIDNVKEVIGNTGDNADAWDMTPNSSVITNTSANTAAAGRVSGEVGASGETSASPYKFDEDDNPSGWNNTELADWLETNCGDGDEQPGSSGDGNKFANLGDRGVKLYEKCRRLYQKVTVEVGAEYTFKIDSRSEAEGINSEIFILNNEIVNEDVLIEGAARDANADSYFLIENDFNASKSSSTNDTFTTNTFDFIATTTTAVIYVRSTDAIDGSNEVFFDNISLVKKATASINDVFSSKISIYPNPANDFLQVSSEETITGIEVYNLIGKKVISKSKLINNKIDVSHLSKGVYVLKVLSNDIVGSRKIIIE